MAAAIADRQEASPSGSGSRSAARISAHAPAAAPSGSRWPGPSDGPQPQIGQQRDVDLAAQRRRMPVVEVGVAGEPDAARRTKPSVASSTRPRRGRRVRRARRGRRVTRRRPTVDRLARPAPRASTPKPHPAEQLRGAGGQHRGRAGPRAPQRRLVEVVVVQVRDQHAVDARQRRAGVGPRRAQVRDAARAARGSVSSARAGRSRAGRWRARARRSSSRASAAGSLGPCRDSPHVALAPASHRRGGRSRHPLRTSTDAVHALAPQARPTARARRSTRSRHARRAGCAMLDLPEPQAAGRVGARRERGRRGGRRRLLRRATSYRAARRGSGVDGALGSRSSRWRSPTRARRACVLSDGDECGSRRARARPTPPRGRPRAGRAAARRRAARSSSSTATTRGLLGRPAGQFDSDITDGPPPARGARASADGDAARGRLRRSPLRRRRRADDARAGDRCCSSSARRARSTSTGAARRRSCTAGHLLNRPYSSQDQPAPASRPIVSALAFE